jgi:hypothetical protein
MKNILPSLILLTSLIGLTGCETAKYTLDQTFGQKREFGPNSMETQNPPSDIMVADADQWVRRNLW